jgi:hypothetical protein
MRQSTTRVLMTITLIALSITNGISEEKLKVKPQINSQIGPNGLCVWSNRSYSENSHCYYTCSTDYTGVGKCRGQTCRNGAWQVDITDCTSFPNQNNCTPMC